MNQKYPDADLQVREAQEAAEAKRQIEIVAPVPDRAEMAFATLAQRVQTHLCDPGRVFNSRRQRW